jgi:hypothetical protein
MLKVNQLHLGIIVIKGLFRRAENILAQIKNIISCPIFPPLTPPSFAKPGEAKPTRPATSTDLS